MPESHDLSPDGIDPQLFTRGPVVVFRWVAAPGWPVTFVTPNAADLFGHSAEAFTGGLMGYADVIHPDDLDRVTREVADSAAAGADHVEHQGYRIIRADGAVRWMRNHTRIERDTHGTPAHYLGYVYDMTACQEAESAHNEMAAALRRSERRYRELIATTTQGLWIIDPEDRTTVDVNPALCRMLGYDREEMIGHTPMAFTDTENARIFRDQTGRIGSTRNRIYRITLKACDGLDVHTQFNATTVVDEADRPEAAVALVTDLTEAVNCEDELRKALGDLERFVELASHDLQEPPRNVVSYAQMLERHCQACLDPQYCDRVFGIFQRLQPPETEDGTGIGPALCWRIVERHGGRIRAASAPGEGTRVVFSLPLSDDSGTGHDTHGP